MLRLFILMIVMGGVGGAGCTSTPRTSDEALAVVRNREADPSRRVEAVADVQPDGSGKGLFKSLSPIVWSSREPLSLRVACMDRLIASDAETFWAIASKNIPSIQQPAMLVEVCRRAGVSQRTELTGSLVRSWSRPSRTIADSDRPEARALRVLHGFDDDDRLTSLLGDLLAEPAATTLEEQMAAWVVWSRLEGVDRATVLLRNRSWEPDTPGRVATALIEADKVLSPLPHQREEVLWLMALAMTDSPTDWLTAPAALPEGTAVALRHLPPLYHYAGQESFPTREHLQQRIHQHLDRGGAFHPRGQDDEDEEYVAPLEERFSFHADRLPHLDLYVIVVLLEALQDPDIRRSLFDQADADWEDKSAEHGGLIHWDEQGALFAEGFASRLKRDDRTFISSHALIEAAYVGLAHYHFHTQRHDNAPYAGPGQGDLRFAERMGLTCVVFTFIDVNTLAVDYYQPDGIVVDIGVITRP